MGKQQPALLGGLFIGVLSALPIIGMANMCCCLWVVVGGVLVVYLQQQAKPTPVETGEAVLGGLLAGVIGAVIAGVGMMLVSSIGGPIAQDAVREALEQNNEIPPEMRDRILGWVSGTNLGLLMMVVTVPVYAVFAMAGSLLGLAFFRKKMPPPAAPGQTPMA